MDVEKTSKQKRMKLMNVKNRKGEVKMKETEKLIREMDELFRKYYTKITPIEMIGILEARKAKLLLVLFDGAKI